MGGFGSGRRFGKDCTEDMLALDVRQLQREGRLKPGAAFTWRWRWNGQTLASVHLQMGTDRVRLRCRQREHGGDGQDMAYSVRLDWTSCNYGGQRVWWLCPVPGCGRRVALLFGGPVFACRHCHQLAYRSQRETDEARAARRASKLRDVLGWEPGLVSGPGDKPKGMHWRTFERLHLAHDLHALDAMTGMMERFGRLQQRLDAFEAKGWGV